MSWEQTARGRHSMMSAPGGRGPLPKDEPPDPPPCPPARDPGATERFYVSVLGLRVCARDDARGSVWLDASGVVVMLERAESGEPPYPRTRRSSWRSRSTTWPSWRRRLADAGVAIEAETPHTLYVRDPDGRRVGLSTYAFAAPSAEPQSSFIELAGTCTPCSVAKSMRLVVSGVGVAHDARGRVGREDALEATAGFGRAVGDDDHARVDAHPDADPAAVVEAHPARARGGVDQRVEQGPVGDRVGAVLHGLGLAVGRRDAAAIEVVATDDDRRLDPAGPNELVEREPDPRAVAVSEPADARRQPLEAHARARERRSSARRSGVVGHGGEHGLVGRRDVGRVAAERDPAERPLAGAEERADVRGHEARRCRTRARTRRLARRRGCCCRSRRPRRRGAFSASIACTSSAMLAFARST